VGVAHQRIVDSGTAVMMETMGSWSNTDRAMTSAIWWILVPF
jgi:hypothetical protein